ncbi:MAG: helix-turn-helix transcriptional regulator [Rhodospirillales bacterium]|nr:helix-turn-helix transcriptional regulator [Rhodospirillales bacterium]
MLGYTDLQGLRESIRLRRELPSPAECRALRRAAGVSLAEVGRAVGVSHAAVFAWETGRNRPHGGNLRRYLDALHALREEIGEEEVAAP